MDNDGVKKLIEGLKGDMATIDQALITMTSDELPDTKRDRLIDQKTLYSHIINYFDVEGRSQQLDRELSKNL